MADAPDGGCCCAVAGASCAISGEAGAEQADQLVGFELAGAAQHLILAGLDEDNGGPDGFLLVVGGGEYQSSAYGAASVGFLDLEVDVPEAPIVADGGQVVVLAAGSHRMHLLLQSGPN